MGKDYIRKSNYNYRCLGSSAKKVSNTKVVYLLSLFFITVFIFFCDYNRSLSQGRVRYSEPENLEQVNSQDDEFSPLVYNNKLIFNRGRGGKSVFFQSQIDINSNQIKVSAPKFFRADFNNTEESQSYISIENDSLNPKLYFSKFVKYNGKNVLNLFYSLFKKQTWTKGQKIEAFETPFFCSQAAISPNNDYLVFTASSVAFNGGQEDIGDTDLFISYKDGDGNWTNPEIIGEINTKLSEITPFISGSDGKDTLYFASNGLGGPGGYDLYYSVREGGVFQRPNPIIDLNTEFDESDFVCFGNQVFFSSNRLGGFGNLDIYHSYRETVEENTQGVHNNKMDIVLNSFMSSVKVKRTYDYTLIAPIRYLYFNESKTQDISEVDKVLESKIELLQEIYRIPNSLQDNSNIDGVNLDSSEDLRSRIRAFLYYTTKLFHYQSIRNDTYDTNQQNRREERENNTLNVYLTVISPIDNTKSNFQYNTTNNNINHILNKIQAFFISNSLINKENIQINYVYNPNLSDGEFYIYYDFSNINFLGSKDSGNLLVEKVADVNQISVEPDIIGFEFQARPVAELKNWISYLMLKDKQVIFTSNNASMTFQVDLNKYKESIINYDSLLFYTIANNKQGDEFFDNTRILLNQTKYKAKKLYQFGKNSYSLTQFDLPYYDDLLLKKDLLLNWFLQQEDKKKSEVLVFTQRENMAEGENVILHYIKTNFPNIVIKVIDKGYEKLINEKIKNQQKMVNFFIKE